MATDRECEGADLDTIELLVAILLQLNPHLPLSIEHVGIRACDDEDEAALDERQ